MWSISRPQVAEMKPGPNGHHLDQCPVVLIVVNESLS